MEPLVFNPSNDCFNGRSAQREFLFRVFLHVNRELNDLQRECLTLVVGPKAGPETIATALDRINKAANMLERAGWKPKKATSDAVMRPDHYDRLPMEPTYFIVESGGYHWCIENFIKYICRYRWKNGSEDLRKAMRNLAMYVRWLDRNPGWSR